MSAARLFVALELPPTVAGRLAEWGHQAAARREGLRAVPRENLHVTLAFLGWRAEEEIPTVAQVVQACSAPGFPVALGRAAWLPPRRPGVLVVDVEDRTGSLGRLQGGVVERLTGAIGFEPEARPFRPHVTVARVRRGARVDRRVDEPPAAEPFRPPGVALFRSRPSTAGARYEALARALLG